MSSNLYDLIYENVKKIPKGKVSTYSMIGMLCGNPNYARIVGNALHVNPDTSSIPCHRVVNAKGKTSEAFAFGGEDIQRQLLENEGVGFLKNGMVDMKKYLWRV